MENFRKNFPFLFRAALILLLLLHFTQISIVAIVWTNYVNMNIYINISVLANMGISILAIAFVYVFTKPVREAMIKDIKICQKITTYITNILFNLSNPIFNSYHYSSNLQNLKNILNIYGTNFDINLTNLVIGDITSLSFSNIISYNLFTSMFIILTSYLVLFMLLLISFGFNILLWNNFVSFKDTSSYHLMILLLNGFFTIMISFYIIWFGLEHTRNKPYIRVLIKNHPHAKDVLVQFFKVRHKARQYINFFSLV